MMAEITYESNKRRLQRVERLAAEQRPLLAPRAKVRDLMDGGVHGISRLVGRDVSEDKVDLPVANFIEIASRRLGQKVGRMPTTKVDPPAHMDGKNPRAYADKRARIIAAWDQLSKVELALPRVGRWLPGYGIAVAVMMEATDPVTGEPFPHVEFRDPYNCFVGALGWNQQPDDAAFAYKMTKAQLIELYPHLAKKFEEAGGSDQTASPIIGSDFGRSTGANHSGTGIDVYEYWDKDGTWWLCPTIGELLEYIPNVLSSGPAFRVVVRPTFNQLGGIYDHAIGLVSAIARLNVLSVLAAEDLVFSETVVEGQMLDGKYTKGRRAVNYTEQGTKVYKVNDTFPFQVFQQQETLLQQLRAQASYPVTDDAISPNSFVTGRGLQELASSVDLEVTEFQTYVRHLLEGVDAMRLEYMDEMYPERTLTVGGVKDGEPFTETYIPRRHIAGQYGTRRVYGIMAGWDEPNKIVTGLSLLQAGIIDEDTMREQIDGLENPTKVADRVRNSRLEGLLFQGLAAKLEQGDVNAMAAIVEMLPESEMKELLQQTLVQPALEAAQQQAQAPGPAPIEGPGAGGGPAGAPPNTMTVLQRILGGQAELGAQNVGTIA